ncbi:nuclease-related domain-containing protein [Caballeronia arationis]|uniref:nuclease-related domain-containing protein n=1 Tax=Caballeronia arationis TaxID=1777142 RepID=UPI00117CD591
MDRHHSPARWQGVAPGGTGLCCGSVRTPFGIFIFETKNWSGRIAPSRERPKIERPYKNGSFPDHAYRRRA